MSQPTTKYSFNTQGFSPMKIPQEEGINVDHINNNDDLTLQQPQAEQPSFWATLTTSLYTGLDHASAKLSETIDEFNRDMEHDKKQKECQELNRNDKRSNEDQTPTTMTATSSLPFPQKSQCIVDHINQTRSTVITTPINPITLHNILRCAWCTKTIRNPIAMSCCGVSVCYPCFNEMYKIFSAGTTTNTPDIPNTSPSQHSNQPLLLRQNDIQRSMEDLKIDEYNGMIECAHCGVVIPVTSPPSINIALNLVLALLHQHYEVAETTPLMPHLSSIPTTTKSLSSKTTLTLSLDENHSPPFLAALSPSVQVSELPTLQPEQEIVLDINYLDHSPVQHHRNLHTPYNPPPQAPLSTSPQLTTMVSKTTNPVNHDDSEHDLVTQLRNATIAGFRSIENGLNDAFSTRKHAQDDDDYDPEAGIHRKSQLEVKLGDDVDVSTDGGSFSFLYGSSTYE